MGKGTKKPATRVLKSIPIADINTQGGTQTRASLDPTTIASYADLYRANKTALPEPVVYFDGEHHWLSDGFHRVEAAACAGFTEITCEVRKGGTLEAFCYGAGANARHGLPRSNHDKRFVVQQAFRKQTIRDKSDRDIAGICCVSHTFVGLIRAEIAGNVATTRANDSAPVAPKSLPASAPVGISNDGDDPERGPDFLAIEQGEGAGAGLPRGLIPSDPADLLAELDTGIPGEQLVSNNQPRDPGAPKPCPVCNPSGTSATGGWLPGKAA